MLKTSQTPIILASSSPYRKELLQRLCVAFSTHSPKVDESQQPQETPETMALRLSKDKASAVATLYPQHIIIGSDQVCAHGNDVISKPGTHGNAVQQLQTFSGQCVTLHSAITVIFEDHHQTALVTGTVYFKMLTLTSIERYLHKEQPYDCAGACKLEGLGITLVKSIDCEDPTALMGMPMIRLTDMLVNAGIQLP